MRKNYFVKLNLVFLIFSLVVVLFNNYAQNTDSKNSGNSTAQEKAEKEKIKKIEKIVKLDKSQELPQIPVATAIAQKEEQEEEEMTFHIEQENIELHIKTMEKLMVERKYKESAKLYQNLLKNYGKKLCKNPQVGNFRNISVELENYIANRPDRKKFLKAYNELYEGEAQQILLEARATENYAKLNKIIYEYPFTKSALIAKLILIKLHFEKGNINTVNVLLNTILNKDKQVLMSILQSEYEDFITPVLILRSLTDIIISNADAKKELTNLQSKFGNIMNQNVPINAEPTSMKDLIANLKLIQGSIKKTIDTPRDIFLPNNMNLEFNKDKSSEIVKFKLRWRLYKDHKLELCSSPPSYYYGYYARSRQDNQPDLRKVVASIAFYKNSLLFRNISFLGIVDLTNNFQTSQIPLAPQLGSVISFSIFPNLSVDKFFNNLYLNTIKGISIVNIRNLKGIGLVPADLSNIDISPPLETTDKQILAGPPFVSENGVFAGVLEREGQELSIRVVAYNKERTYQNYGEGKILWDTFLGLPLVPSYGYEIKTLPIIVGEDDGIIYVLTNYGVIAALDEQSGNVIWLTPYKYKDKNKSYFSASWNDSNPGYVIIKGNLLIAYPSDSSEIYLLDRYSGRIITAIQSPQVSNAPVQLLGVYGNYLYYVYTPNEETKAVQVYDIKNNNILSSPIVSVARDNKKAFLTNKYIYIPVANGLIRAESEPGTWGVIEGEDKPLKLVDYEHEEVTFTVGNIYVNYPLIVNVSCESIDAFEIINQETNQ